MSARLVDLLLWLLGPLAAWHGRLSVARCELWFGMRDRIAWREIFVAPPPAPCVPFIPGGEGQDAS